MVNSGKAKPKIFPIIARFLLLAIFMAAPVYSCSIKTPNLNTSSREDPQVPEEKAQSIIPFQLSSTKLDIHFYAREDYIIGGDKELADIWDRIHIDIRTFEKYGKILVDVIYTLENQINQNPSSSKIDRLLFLSGLAKKNLAGVMWYSIKGGDETVKDYYSKHKNEFEEGSKGEGRYLSGDLIKLMEMFPYSPLVEEAAYAISLNRTKGFQCKGDMDCQLRLSIGAFLPFLMEYPDSLKVRATIGWINKYHLNHFYKKKVKINHPEESFPLLLNYYYVIKDLPDRTSRAGGLYPVAHAFENMRYYTQAYVIFGDLKENYADLFTDGDYLQEDYRRLKNHVRNQNFDV